MAHKLPAMMLYPSDWEGDEIAFCTISAQGLWLRMMFLMHRSTRYGYLALPNGSPIPARVVAAKCGTTEPEYLSLLAELDSVGKVGRTPEGVLYSRRMVRDEQKRSGDRKRKEDERNRKRDVTGHVTPVVTPPVTPLSGGSSVTPSSTEKKQKPSHDKRESNPMFAVFKGLLLDAWKEWGNPLDMPWDGAEGKQLSSLIGANPKLGPDGMRRLLQCRARSTGVNLAERPSKWLRGLTDYARGPLNQFKQPENTNGIPQQNRPVTVGVFKPTEEDPGMSDEQAEELRKRLVCK